MTGKTCCYTSFTFSYLARARLLAWSLKRFHPDWHFVAVITDTPPDGFDFDPAEELFDEVIWGRELPVDDINAWLFRHDLVESCTAVKGPVMDLLCNREDTGMVVYLDPDIAVFSPLGELFAAHQGSEILLTPHQLEPDADEVTIADNEICSLQHGIYNLGFIAVRTGKEGRRFARWWSDRLLAFCYDDIPSGLFTDQRWCDLVPAFFDRVGIVRDPGCNVASWNLSRRRLEVTPHGDILVNGSQLKFYHFTKFGSVGAVMTERYAGDNIEVFELWKWYGRKLEEFIPAGIPDGYWGLANFENGTPIQKRHRRLYRQRPDLQAAFPDPYTADFHAWLVRHG